MSQIVVTPDGGSAVTVTCIPGTLKVIARNGMDRNHGDGDSVPVCVKGEGLTGEAEVLVDSSAPSLATLMGLRSLIGVGSTVVEWTDILAGAGAAYGCLLDVEVGNDGVQTVLIKWNGTKVLST